MFKDKSTPHATRKVFGVLGTNNDNSGAPQDLEFLSEMEPPEGLKLYNKMRRNDPIVGGLVLHIERLIHRLSWKVEGPNESFIRKQLEDIKMDRILLEIASTFTFGFYLGELILSTDNGKIVLSDIEPRWQPTIDGIKDGKVIQSATSGTYEIPYDKTLHFIALPQNRSPFGLSPLRSLYKPYYYKIAIEASEAVSIDRDLSGLPTLTAPEGVDFTAADSSSPNYNSRVAETMNWAIDLVGKVRKDEQQGVVLPNGWALNIIRGSESKIDTIAIINRYNTEMATGILEGFLSLGAFASSNNANVEAHVDNFLDACNSFASSIADAMNLVIAKICLYNAKQPPKFSFAPANKPKLADLASYVGRLVKNGVITPTIPIEKELLTMANLPYNDEEANKKPTPVQ